MSRLLDESQDLYDRGDFRGALTRLEAVVERAVDPGTSQSALCRMAAITWYNLADGPGTLVVLSRLSREAAERSEMRILLDRLSEKIVEDLRALIRRGERKEAFRQVASLLGHLAGNVNRLDQIQALYFAELASSYVMVIEGRLAKVNKGLNLATSHLAKLAAESSGGKKSSEAGVEQVECQLKTYSLSEEREVLVQYRSELIRRELSLLRTCTPDMYMEFVETSRQDRSLGEVLDTLHRLCLEKMHYRTTARLEAKDYLMTFLPSVLARPFTNRVYSRVCELEDALAAGWSRFMAGRYPRPEAMDHGKPSAA